MAFWLVAGALLGCGRGGETSIDFRHNKGGGTPLATFDGDSITVEEVQQRLAEMSPYARVRYQTLEEKRDYVDGLARFEMMVAEARKRGLASDPEVVMAAKRVMVQRLLQKELEEKASPISDAEVADYYEKHKNDYVKPEMVRLSHIFFAAPASDEAARAAKKKQAEDVLARAKALPPLDYQSFGVLVRESSEEPRTKPLDGDMRYLSPEELSSQYGSELVKAVEGVNQVGTVVPALVETAQGLHVVKFQGRQAALNLSRDQVKAQIQNILLNEKKMGRYSAFLESVRQGASYRLDEARLSKLEVDMKAPAVEAKGPQPGFIPTPMRPAVK